MCVRSVSSFSCRLGSIQKKLETTVVGCDQRSHLEMFFDCTNPNMVRIRLEVIFTEFEIAVEPESKLNTKSAALKKVK